MLEDDWLDQDCFYFYWEDEEDGNFISIEGVDKEGRQVYFESM